MRNRRDFYKLLHVQPDAPLEVIRSSYRTLMLQLHQHPDLGGENRNASLLNEAYQTLSDPRKRARYDRELLPVNRAQLLQIDKVKGKGGAWPGSRSDTAGGNGYGWRQDLGTPLASRCPFCRTPHGEATDPDSDRLCSCCGSPLKPPAKIGLETGQRRAVQRVARGGAVTFYTDWPQRGHHGHIRDLSPLGMQIVAEMPLRIAQIMKIESELLNAVARVAHCRSQHDGEPHRYAVGMEFLTLRFRHSLGTFVSHMA